MHRTHTARFAALVVVLLLAPAVALAQGGRRDDYSRAELFLNDEIKKLAFDGQVDAHWIGESSSFWYMTDGPDGKAFLIVDAAQATRAPAFDHQRLAQSLSRAAGTSYTARQLPFQAIRFVDGRKSVAFNVGGAGY